MKKICFSVLLADSEVLVASLPCFGTTKHLENVIEALHLFTFVDTKLDCSGPG